jgi:DNA-binding NarL/FixJ family response regulator
MRFLMVEDNRSYGDMLYDSLSKIGDVSWLVSERAFHDDFDLMKAEPPDVAVIDSMLRWDYPRRPGEQPEHVETDLYTAGIRCAQRLWDTKETHHVPVVLYTVIDVQDLLNKVAELPPNITYIPKASDQARVIEAVRKAAAERVRD